MLKKVISIVVSFFVLCLSAYTKDVVPMASFADELYQEDTICTIGRAGALPEGDAYKNLEFYGGEAEINDINGASTRALPSFIDLSTSPCFPPLGHQGNSDACVAFATTYYQFSYEVNRMNGVASSDDRVVYSPKWTYNSINLGVDNGAYMTDAFTILSNFGALKSTDLPFDSNYQWIPGNTNLNSDEMIEERMEALETRVSTLYSCSLPNTGTFIDNPNDSDLFTIKNLLNLGKVLTITTPNLYNYKNGVDRNNSTIKVNYRCRGGGGHAMTVVGYDDNVWCDVNENGVAENCEKGAFKIADSYGETGNTYDTNGFMWVLYDALNEVSANNINNWESYLSGTRVQALRYETSSPTFWYISVSKNDVHYVGEIEIDTGNNELADYQFRFGRSTLGSNNPSYANFNMLPATFGAGTYKGKILFDYDYFCSPISSYYNGYNWYVKFTEFATPYTFNFKLVDSLENVISDYGTSNANDTKYVNISIKHGDVDYNSMITSTDSDMILLYISGEIELSNLQYVLADFNRNGEVTMADAAAILQYIGQGGMK